MRERKFIVDLLMSPDQLVPNRLFSLGSLNVTTDDELVAYIKQVYIPDGTPADLDAVTSAYPSDPEQGSPYNTGFLNALTPEYKRIASMQGDLVGIHSMKSRLNQFTQPCRLRKGVPRTSSLLSAESSIEAESLVIPCALSYTRYKTTPDSCA